MNGEVNRVFKLEEDEVKNEEHELQDRLSNGNYKSTFEWPETNSNKTNGVSVRPYLIIYQK